MMGLLSAEGVPTPQFLLREAGLMVRAETPPVLPPDAPHAARTWSRVSPATSRPSLASAPPHRWRQYATALSLALVPTAAETDSADCANSPAPPRRGAAATRHRRAGSLLASPVSRPVPHRDVQPHVRPKLIRMTALSALEAVRRRRGRHWSNAWHCIQTRDHTRFSRRRCCRWPTLPVVDRWLSIAPSKWHKPYPGRGQQAAVRAVVVATESTPGRAPGAWTRVVATVSGAH